MIRTEVVNRPKATAYLCREAYFSLRPRPFGLIFAREHPNRGLLTALVTTMENRTVFYDEIIRCRVTLQNRTRCLSFGNRRSIIHHEAYAHVSSRYFCPECPNAGIADGEFTSFESWDALLEHVHDVHLLAEQLPGRPENFVPSVNLWQSEQCRKTAMERLQIEHAGMLNVPLDHIRTIIPHYPTWHQRPEAYPDTFVLLPNYTKHTEAEEMEENEDPTQPAPSQLASKIPTSWAESIPQQKGLEGFPISFYNGPSDVFEEYPSKVTSFTSTSGSSSTATCRAALESSPVGCPESLKTLYPQVRPKRPPPTQSYLPYDLTAAYAPNTWSATFRPIPQQPTTHSTHDFITGVALNSGSYEDYTRFNPPQ